MTTPYLSAAALMMIAFAVSFVGLRMSSGGRCARRHMKPIFLHAANPGPMTGDGNWTYLIGARQPVLIDAGVGHAVASRRDCRGGAARPVARAS